MNPIGINWAAVWDDAVWGPVWRQAVLDDKPAKHRRPSRSRITLRAPVTPKPPKKRAKKVQKLLPPIVIPEPITAIPPPSSLERYVDTLISSPPTEGVFSSTLSGCTLKMEGKIANRGLISATLEGVEMEMNMKAMMYDDAVGIFLGMPELEPELVDA